MKKTEALKILLFFVIFAVIMVPVSYLLRPDDGHTKAVFSGFYAEEKNSLDTVFIGSSAAYRYFVSPQLWKNYGITSCVLGTSAQPPDTVPYLMAEAQKTQNPSLYVVEIRRLIMEDYNLKNNLYQTQSDRDTQLRQVTDNLTYSLNRINLINNTVSGDKTNWLFDIIHNHSNWKSITLNSFGLMLYNKKNSLKSATTIGTWTKLQKFETSSYIDEKTELESKTKQKLLDVLTYCKKNNLNVLFVSTPYVESESYLAVENYAADIIKSYGYKYLNCNYYYDDIGIDFSSDFYNSQHTNVLGAEKVTDYIGEYIMKNYDVLNKHSESIVKEWDNAYKSWSAIAVAQEEAVQASIMKSENNDGKI